MSAHVTEIDSRHLANRRKAARDLALVIVQHNRMMQEPMNPEQLCAAMEKASGRLWKEFVERTGRTHLPSIETRAWAIEIACAYVAGDVALTEVTDAQTTLSAAASQADRLYLDHEQRTRARLLDAAVTAALHNINRAYAALLARATPVRLPRSA